MVHGDTLRRRHRPCGDARPRYSDGRKPHGEGGRTQVGKGTGRGQHGLSFYTEAPEETLPLYGLGWIPEGFEETDVLYIDIYYKAIYINPKTDQLFVFEYDYMDDGTVPMVIPDEEINLEKTKINGMPADFYQAPKDEDTNILFIFDEESNICFTISASIDRDTMFKIAEHIYLAEATK